MAAITIYDATSVDREQLDLYLGKDNVLEFLDDSIDHDNLRPESEIISVFVSSDVTRELIEKLPNLQLIACRSTGVNNVDLAAAEVRGVAVVNVPTYGEHTVAEYTFLLMLALTRRLPASIQALRTGDFDQSSLVGIDIVGKTLGIIGAGRIGRHVAQEAIAFGMKVIAYDPFPDKEKAQKLGFTYVSLDELARSSDIISLHAPLTKDNQHIVNEDFLGKVKPTALLINTARGELIDTTALIAALRSKKLAGAALDVIEGEHLVKVDEEVLLLRRDTVTPDLLMRGVQIDVLKRLPNVILTPHNAFNSLEAIDRINKTTAENIREFLHGTVSNKIAKSQMRPGKLIIARHGESEWNASGRWTGNRDVHLSEKGFREAAMLGRGLSDIEIGFAFVSQQIRAFETFQGIVDSAQQFDVPYERSDALNERDYGDYTGMNKWQVKEQLGEEVFHHLRRDWNYPVPNGETLKDVYDRTIPYYRQVIVPKLLEGQNVLIVSHGNVIRALMKYLENISDESIATVEMPFGKLFICEIDADGRMVRKEERQIHSEPPHA